MALAISVFGDETDESIAEVGLITSIVVNERPDIWFDVASNVQSLKERRIESERALHRLRGYAVTCEVEGRAPSAQECQSGYPLLEKLYDGKIASQWYPHLIDHSDTDGYYIPADFPQPINAYDDGEVISIGSSARLLAELNSIKRFLFAGAADDDDAVPEIDWAVAESDPLANEKRIWCALRWFARNSVEGNLVIRFRATNPDFE